VVFTLVPGMPQRSRTLRGGHDVRLDDGLEAVDLHVALHEPDGLLELASASVTLPICS
jgi:hypothetical protein